MSVFARNSQNLYPMFHYPFYKRGFFLNSEIKPMYSLCLTLIMSMKRSCLFKRRWCAFSAFCNLHYSYAKQMFVLCITLLQYLLVLRKIMFCVWRSLTVTKFAWTIIIFKCLHFHQKSSMFWPGAIKGSLIFEMWTCVRSPHWHTVRFWCVRKSFGHLWFLLKVYVSYMKTILNIYF